MIRSKVQPFPLLVLALALCTMSAQRPDPAPHSTTMVQAAADTLPQTRLHIEVFAPDGIPVTDVNYEVFRSEGDGSRTLLRTGRAKFNAFDLQLDAEPARYVLVVTGAGYLRKELPFWSEVADISHDITLLPDPNRRRGGQPTAQSPQPSKTNSSAASVAQAAAPPKAPRPKVPAPDAAQSAAPALLPPPAATPPAVFKLTDGTTLRGGPGHETSFLLRLHRDYEVQLLEKTNGKWWKIRYKDRTGYVPADLLSE